MTLPHKFYGSMIHKLLSLHQSISHGHHSISFYYPKQYLNERCITFKDVTPHRVSESYTEWCYCCFHFRSLHRHQMTES